LYVWSSASEAKKATQGKYSGLENFDTEGAVWRYIQEPYPEPAMKTSLLQMGMHITNRRWGAGSFNWVQGASLITVPAYLRFMLKINSKMMDRLFSVLHLKSENFVMRISQKSSATVTLF